MPIRLDTANIVFVRVSTPLRSFERRPVHFESLAARKPLSLLARQHQSTALLACIWHRLILSPTQISKVGFTFTEKVYASNEFLLRKIISHVIKINSKS